MKDDWKIVKLGEICEFTRGLSYKKVDEREYSSKVVLRSNNVELLSGQLNLEELKYLDDDYAFPSGKVVKKDSLLICMSNGSKQHLGKVALVDKDYGYAFGAFMGQLTPRAGLLGKYFLYVLMGPDYKRYIQSLTDGANINNLKYSDLAMFEIPLPPIETQRKIVKYLDEKFAKIEAMDERTKELVAEAEELFQSTLNQSFTPPLHSSTWQHKRLGDVCEIIGGSTPPTSVEEYWDGDKKWITPAEISDSNKYVYDSQRHITDKAVKSCSLRLLPKGTVIFSSRAPIGKVAIACEELYCNQGFKNLVCSTSVYNEFLYYFLILKRDYLNSIGTGATFRELSKSALSKVEISLPPIETQREIVEKLDKIRGKVEVIKSFAQLSSLSNDELKQSLLHDVFTNGKISKEPIL